MFNIQTGIVGCQLKHDVFGFCTHIDDPNVAAGSFKVKVNADGSVEELTTGHFQFVSAASENVDAEPASDTAGNVLPVTTFTVLLRRRAALPSARFRTRARKAMWTTRFRLKSQQQTVTRNLGRKVGMPTRRTMLAARTRTS
eukprot:4157516-Pleurochrysis_carterae.AAC.1